MKPCLIRLYPAAALCRLVGFIVLLSVPIISAHAIAVVKIHDFVPYPTGNNPIGKLIQGPDGSFYGATRFGGLSNSADGAIFKLDTHGNVTTLHSFSTPDGAWPLGSMVIGGDGNFYGTTLYGGQMGTGPARPFFNVYTGTGAVYKITPSGTFTRIHAMFGYDGVYPSTLVRGIDGNFYGVNTQGGANANGVVFKVTPSGALTTLYAFSGGADGGKPAANLLQRADGNFYGVTQQGGDNGDGTIYKITPSGAITTLYSFADSDGLPIGGLVQAGDGNLYGTTQVTGLGSDSVYRVTSTGTFTIVHALTFPEGLAIMDGLVVASDGSLYGTTNSGGAFGLTSFGGTVFRVTTSGAFTVLHSFSGTDGANVRGGLIQGIDGNLYGMTASGGVFNNGTIYKITTAGALTSVYSFPVSDGATPYVGGLTEAAGGLFGTTLYGGSSNWGSAYNIAPDKTYTPLHGFTPSEGKYPLALITGSDGNLYGAAEFGGPSNDGTVFSMTPGGTVTTLHSFIGSDGDRPQNGVIEGTDGNFYGTAANGGTSSLGTVFKITPAGVTTVLHSFSGTDGTLPYSTLVQGTDGALYGVTTFGGLNNDGTIFKVTTTGQFSVLHTFTGPDGSGPFAGLIQASDGNFYGTTIGGGSGTGTAFRITPSGVYTVLHLFTGLTGGPSLSPFIQASDGYLYATSASGGAFFSGSIIRMALDGTVTMIYSFNGDDGAEPCAPLMQASDGNLYSTTSNGGMDNAGTVFEVGLSTNVTLPSIPQSFLATPGDSQITLTWSAAGVATSFVILRGLTAGAEAIQPVAVGIKSGQYTDNYLTNGNKYYYEVVAINAGGNSGPSVEVSATPVALVAPTPPTGLTAAPGNGKVTLSWSASPGASSYNIYRGTTSYGQSATPIATGVAGTSYVNSGLTNGVTYYYRIAAFNAVGHSAEGNQAAATPLPPPAIPTGLTAQPGNAKVTLSWTASAGATSYNVYRGTSSFGESATPVAIGVTGTTYVNGALTNGVTYYYRIAAFNAGGNSAEGNQAAATPIAPPAVPTNLTATAGTGSVTLSWTASAGATSYNVYRGTSSFGESGTPVATNVHTATYVDSAGTQGTTYFYRVAAFNVAGNSAEGNQASATP